MKILSLGAGVQSTTLLLMSCRGDLPKLDCAIFADTQWEPQHVYEHLDWLEGYAAEHGILVHRVTKGDIRADALTKTDHGEKFASMPIRILNNNGEDAMGRRQCTREYKVAPIDRFIRYDLLGLKKGQRIPAGTQLDQWMGISVDEAHRMKSSPPWKRHVYPFIGLPEQMLPRPWTRAMCRDWLLANYPERVVPRSACIGCPYHSNAEWRDMKDNDPASWADAVDFDESIRTLDRMDGEAFVHRSCTPLADVDLRTDEDKGQLVMWGEECEGMCGV